MNLVVALAYGYFIGALTTLVISSSVIALSRNKRGEKMRRDDWVLCASFSYKWPYSFWVLYKLMRWIGQDPRRFDALRAWFNAND